MDQLNGLPQLTQEEIELAEILIDPVKFALHHFQWNAYPYQEEILRDNSLRQVLRLARRMGKTDCMAMKAINLSYTKGMDPEDPTTRPAVVLITAPFENQVKAIFQRIRELISKSPFLQSSIEKDTQNPETIKWKNGSYIKGFTAGSKAGSGAASIRGQRADWIIIDEIDYMTDADIIAVFAIASDPNTGKPGIIVSSTPTGRRSKFWEICLDGQRGVASVPPGKYVGDQWTVFYYPYTSHPEYQSPEAKAAYEAEWKLNLGEIGFIHECLAEFGEETEGVFAKEYIDRAKRNYVYPKRPKQGNIRVIGTDWDVFQATPTLCCLEYCPDEINSDGQRGMFKVINRVSILRTEYTLDAGVKKIIEWNGVYQPDYIYVDRGYGQYQVERLHILGKEVSDNPNNPAYKLDERVIGVSFSENREIKDPGTGELTKKPVKPWMVSQTQIMFERDRLIINSDDPELWKQLENYRIEKIAVDGRPTYTSVKEHSVDALMLCVLAVVDKFPELTRLVQRFDPTRSMAIAPPLQTPAFNVHRINNDINYDEGDEFFVSPTVKANNAQTWFRVNDIRDTVRNRQIDKNTYDLFKKSPFVPRGIDNHRKPKKRSRF
jgi:hypothetical protein